MSDSAYTILIAEDDDSIRHALTDVLTASGYEVLALEEGLAAIHAVRERNFDLALLDVAMPGADGFQVLQAMSEERPGTPVIMLTARGEEEDRVQGLKLGADDYIVKPFSIRELLARIEAVLRRSPERPRQLREIRNLSMKTARRVRDYMDWYEINTRSGTVKDGRETSLTAREFEFLTYMATHPNRVITRDELLRRVWDVDPRLTDTRSVEMTVMRLRDKLGAISASPLETLRSQGYRWNSSFVS